MNDSSIQKIKRIEEIDYLRGFAILAVIAIHTSANFTRILNINMLLVINVIIDVFSHFAVPLFIFISGFVLSINYKGLFSHKIFLQKRAKSILPPYIIFSILYTLLNITHFALNDFEFPSIKRIIFNFLIANSYYHLWYFALIIQFYIFYPYIIKTYENFVNFGRIPFFIIFALITQQLWLIIRVTAIKYFDIYFNSVNDFDTVLSIILDRVFFSHIFYFILGIYVSQNYEYIIDKIFRVKKWILPIIIIFTGLISVLWINGIVKYGSYYNIPKSYFLVPDLLGSIYFPLIFSIFFITTLKFTIIKNKFAGYSKTVLLIGRYSFGIYLIHPLYIKICMSLLFPQFGVYFYHLIFYPVLFILTLLLSYLSVHVTSYLPFSEIIIGIKNKN